MEQLEEKALNIHTDGSCYESPRKEGVSYLFVSVDEQGTPDTRGEPSAPAARKLAGSHRAGTTRCLEAAC